jgi:hypothetical protein
VRRQGGKAARRQVASALFALLAILPSCQLASQTLDTVPKRTSFVIRYGKWAAVGASIGLGLLARDRNIQAEAAYDELNDRCFDVPESCITGPGGGYLDPVSERLYRNTVAYDKQASQFLIAAEVTFVVSVALFVYDLTGRQDRPPNIPFEPNVEYTPTATRVSLTLKF